LHGHLLAAGEVGGEFKSKSTDIPETGGEIFASAKNLGRAIYTEHLSWNPIFTLDGGCVVLAKCTIVTSGARAAKCSSR
jgi:hypothetical protein